MIKLKMNLDRKECSKYTRDEVRTCWVVGWNGGESCSSFVAPTLTTQLPPVAASAAGYSAPTSVSDVRWRDANATH